MQKLFLCSVLSSITLFNTGVARADQALIVDSTSRQLPFVGQALRAQGFHVTTLSGKNASSRDILRAVNTLRTRTTPQERLVFYFVGGGTLDGRGNPVLSTAGRTRLPVADLHRALCAIPARGRTVLLETSFVPRQSTLMPRFSRAASAPPSKACYFVASQAGEPALRIRIDGRLQPVFTHYVLKHLKAADTLRWDEFARRVQSDVARHSSGRQHPRFSAEYARVAVFHGLPLAVYQRVSQNPTVKAVGSSPTESLQPHEKPVDRNFLHPRSIGSGTWGDYSEFNVLRSALDLRLQPERIQVRVGEEVAFAVQVGEAGYLVVLERGTSGKTNLVFPASGQAEDAVVERGQKMMLPGENQAFVADSPGLERLRGFLFRDSASAQSLLRNFENGSTLNPETPLKMRPVTPFTVLPGGFYTSDVLFEVLP